MSIIQLLVKASGIVWATPIIILLLGSSIWFTVSLHFVQVRNMKRQIKLLTKTTSSDTGITPFQAFCNTVAYRVGVSNMAGVATAVFLGGPGSVIWMAITSVLNAALSYAENSLGQVYKESQDGVYTGGAPYYMNKGRGWKILPAVFAFLTAATVPLLAPAPHANNVAIAFNQSLGIPRWVCGAVIGCLLFLVISGGIKRIAKVAEMIVPFMTLLYLGLTVAILVINAPHLPQMFSDMITSAFGANAVYGALIGSAIMMGVKRSVSFSGAGMAESVGPTSAAEVDHPGETGLVSSMTVFIDVAICICTGLLIMATDCFNVVGTDGQMIHIGTGAEFFATATQADISWVQASINTLLPIGSIIIALCLVFFSFTTNMNHYYQGEINLRYLFRNCDVKVRSAAVWGLRIVMVVCYFTWAISDSSDMWALQDLACGVLVWINVIVLLTFSRTIITLYKDYQDQLKHGIETPVFNPEKLGIKGAGFWMEHNKDKFREVEEKMSH